MWDDDEWPYEAAITVIPQNARPFSISRGANICIKMTERKILW